MPTTLPENRMIEIESAVRTYLQTHKSITNREVRQLTGISYDQAISFFNEMLRAGRFERVGVYSGTRYVLPRNRNQ